MEAENKPIEKPVEKPVEKPISGLKRFEKNMYSAPPLLLSDYEHKAFVTTPNVKHKIENSEDILTKDLRLSFLDPELAFIYSLKANCAEEARELGMPNLAKRRMVNLVVKLSLLASVKGRERWLQNSPNISINDTMGGIDSPQFPNENKMDNLKKNLGF